MKKNALKECWILSTKAIFTREFFQKKNQNILLIDLDNALCFLELTFQEDSEIFETLKSRGKS